MSRADELLARGRAVAERDRPPVDVEPAPPRPPAPPRTDPVRQTFDLPPATHRQLGAWRLETSLQLGLDRRPLSGQRAMEAIIAAVLADPAVARRVRLQLEQWLVDGAIVAPLEVWLSEQAPQAPPEAPDVPE